MRKHKALLACLTGLLILAVVVFVACEDSEEGDIPPPGTSSADDDDEFICDISNEGLSNVDFTTDCFDPTGEGNSLTVTEVLGQGEVLIDGRRVQITGAFDFATIGEGKIEASIGCAAYNKCSFPFAETSGDYMLRLDTAGCADISKPQEITLTVHDQQAGTSHHMCTVFLGAPPTGDDDTDDDDWDCDISDIGLASVPFAANCYPLDAGDTIEITDVLGSAALLDDGERFEVRGTHAFTSLDGGKIEITIGCPDGAAYPKCSWPFTTPDGDFQARVQVSNCDPLTAPDRLTINLWNEATDQTTTVCEITLGESTDDDDTSKTH